MQTTLRIDETIYRQAKAEAASEGITMTKFIEEGLRLRLAQAQVQSTLQRQAEGERGAAIHSPDGELNRAQLLKRLDRLFEQADKRDQMEKGSAGPFSRQELYADRLDRFR